MLSRLTLYLSNFDKQICTVVVRLVCFAECFSVHQPPDAVPNITTDVSARVGIPLTMLRSNRCGWCDYQDRTQRRTPNKKHESGSRLDFIFEKGWVLHLTTPDFLVFLSSQPAVFSLVLLVDVLYCVATSTMTASVLSSISHSPWAYTSTRSLLLGVAMYHATFLAV